MSAPGTLVCVGAFGFLAIGDEGGGNAQSIQKQTGASRIFANYFPENLLTYRKICV